MSLGELVQPANIPTNSAHPKAFAARVDNIQFLPAGSSAVRCR